MLAKVQQVRKDAAELAAAPLWSLTETDMADLLLEAFHAHQATLVMVARLVGQADLLRMPATHGYRATHPWLASLLRIDPQPAKDLVAHAAVLTRQPAVEQAVLDGQVNLGHATVIAATIKSLPDQLADFDQLSLTDTRELVVKARDTMIDMAGHLPPYQLRKVGDRILGHVAPELAEQADAAFLARQDARNQQRRGVTLSLPVDGLVRLSGLLDAEDAATVNAALHPLCKPIPGDERTKPQQRADALVEVCRLALRTGDLPEDGGEPPQVVVTVRFDPLTAMLGVGITDTGQRFSAATVRRMACDARIVPVVLGSKGQVLDVGRSHRLATAALRRALHIRDRGCTFPGCDRPPRWTDVHHVTGWIDGGSTDLDNLVLLCRAHHRLIHHPTAGWQVRLGPGQRPEFIPPPTIDPQRQPRRNLYHRSR